MSKISIVELEVFFNVGVTDEERAKPQRILVTVDMEYDFSAAVKIDRLNRTIDYTAVAKTVVKFTEGRSWRLIEKLATDIADKVLSEHHPQAVVVEVKKFVIPEAKHVSVTVAAGQFATSFLRRTT